MRGGAGPTGVIEDLYIIVRITGRDDDDVAVSGAAAGLKISVPAFSLCHFPKMWVSLVNTLNPRPKEHIMASCSVGNRLATKRHWGGEACQIAFHPCATIRRF